MKMIFATVNARQSKLTNLAKLTGVLSCVFGTAAMAQNTPFEFSAFVLEDFTAPSSTSNGPIFSGGDIDINGYSVNYEAGNIGSNYGLLAQGDISFSQGRVYQGGIIAGGSVENVSLGVIDGLEPGATFAGNAILPIDFSKYANKYISMSRDLNLMDSNGVTDLTPWSVTFRGDCSKQLQVFKIDAKDLKKRGTIDLECIPEGASIVINISSNGEQVTALNNKDLRVFEPYARRTIFNFPHAEDILLSGVTLEGVLLAPKAGLKTKSGNSKVAIVAKSWSGPMTLGYQRFTGRLTPEIEIDPVEKCSWSSSVNMPDYNQVMAAPVVAQLNDDNSDGVIDSKDTPDIIFPTFRGSAYLAQGLLRAIDGDTCEEVWTVSASGPWVDPVFTPAVADLDGDGTVEIVTGSGGGGSLNKLTAFDHTGDIEWQTLTWNAKGFPSIADLDRDGTPEIAYQSYVLDNKGNILFRTFFENREAIIFEPKLDGNNVVLTQGSFYNSRGERTLLDVTGSKQSIGNFDADAYPEIVTVKDNNLYLLDHLGKIVWGPVRIPGPGWGTTTVAQLNETVESEIILASGDYVTAFSADGALLWTTPVSDASSKSTGATAFDFDGDAIEEILYADENSIYILNGTDGSVIWSKNNSSATAYEYPVVADTDNDGHAEFIVVSNNFEDVSGTSGITVFENRKDDFMPARGLWNQYSYHGTNIKDDFTIPVNEQPSWFNGGGYRSSTLR